ncbi:hypothetical protein [Rhizobium rhizogenes]|uniref:hypothetical protein n=1 Tax=Rhizobium rhizogenes TaxID=359 RepID=UPI0004D5D006|nr:hypothetical protein [Rhizobium rhizogenes]KEA07121.1 hypothetical protein CN09_09195 [Rhizobium rhizogenes]NTI80454.1 hypothetical protein [Rhizobium rhizogenes]NTJ22640.1 hypothetical protein [Rhizobium rhizogenes]QUE81343.1 hypothetical protein EML492_05925 [Rhizobium rhizogenes]TQO80561.1 hypothetical protein FFE80_05515 [Rhizobium rhizogenes]
MFAQQFAALGYQQITSLSSATPLTVPAGANFAVVAADTAAVRWRDDGAAPTASVGMHLSNTGEPLQYSGPLSKIQFIAETGSPVLNVSYYRIAG